MERMRIKKGCQDAGERVRVLGPPILSPVTHQSWTPVLRAGAEDPDWYKTALLEPIPQTMMPLEALKDARDRMIELLGTDCECDNTHEQNGTECCLCEYKAVLKEGNKWPAC